MKLKTGEISDSFTKPKWKGQKPEAIGEMERGGEGNPWNFKDGIVQYAYNIYQPISHTYIISLKLFKRTNNISIFTTIYVIVLYRFNSSVHCSYCNHVTASWLVFVLY